MHIYTWCQPQLTRQAGPTYVHTQLADTDFVFEEPSIDFVEKMQDTKDLKTVCEQAAASLGYSRLKPQQLEAMMQFLGGKDVFVVLPTGFGKSLIYACMPLVFDILHATNDSMVVVITPLTAIMKDQVILPMLNE